MGVTVPRILENAVVAIAPQTAFGAAASSAGAVVRALVARSALRRGAEYQDQQGSHGSEFERNTKTEVATRPGASLAFYAASRAFLAAILELATRGRPTATLAGGDLTETGDTDGVLSAWTLAGVRPGLNTDTGFRIYVKLEDETPGAGQARVSLYKDAARAELVAQGSAANGATATLAEQNSSGLTGTVALGTVTASNLASIVLAVGRIRFARSSTIERYFTIFRDTGQELETLRDCAIASLKLSSREGDAVLVEVEIAAGAYLTPASSALTPSVAAADREWFAHGKSAFTWNAVAQSAIALEHGIEHDLEQVLANADAPAAIWSRGSGLLPITLAERFANESRVIRNDGAAMTERAAVVTYTYGPKSLVFTYPTCRCVGAELPETGPAAWADHVLTLEPRDDATQDPVQITLQL